METSLKGDEKQVNQQSLSYDENWDMRGSEVKNPSAMQEPQEMQVQSLGREDPLEEGMATHSSILIWNIPWSLVGYSPWGCKESDMTENALTHANIK